MRFCNIVFFWFGNNGTDAAIVTLLPTEKSFSCNEPWTGAQSVFAVKAFYKHGDSLESLTVNFEESSGFVAIVLFHRPVINTCSAWVT
jgi:hypothetical protein